MNADCKLIMDDFRNNHEFLCKAKQIIEDKLKELMMENNIYVVAIEARVKDEKSLEGKLERKGYKYHSLSDITDIIGARIITFYTTEVDKVASIIAQNFYVDWENSIDKRKAHAIDQFGYMSLHYICSIPETMYKDPEHPRFNTIRFEIQMRTALQHVWSTVHHDFGYKTNIEIPRQYARKLVRLASLLEVADEEFSELVTEIADYRRHVKNLISCGSLSEIELNGDSFKSFLESEPFRDLNERIASINNAEIESTNIMHYLPGLWNIGIQTLGDLDKMIKENSDNAYLLAAMQLNQTDLDIVASTIGIRNLCIVHMLKSGKGEAEIAEFFNKVDGWPEQSLRKAKSLMKYADKLNFAENC